jgi:hypothetical protein
VAVGIEPLEDDLHHRELLCNIRQGRSTRRILRHGGNRNGSGEKQSADHGKGGAGRGE